MTQPKMRNNMELKIDKTTKILLGAIALGLFLNASNVFISKAYANDCATWEQVRTELGIVVDNQIHIGSLIENFARTAQHNIIECIRFDATCLAHLKNLQQ